MTALRKSFLVTLTLGAVACAAPSGQTAGAQFVTQVPWATNGVWLRVDTHVHTRFSDGSHTIAEIVARAASGGCDALAITDHTDKNLSAASAEYFKEIEAARVANPKQAVIAGVEWNVPPYDGREHATVLVSPAVERRLNEFKEKFDDYKTGRHDATDAERGFRWLAAEMKSAPVPPVVVYEHPSRKDDAPAENAGDIRAWRAAGGRLAIGFAGAPGHQGKPPIGGYKDGVQAIDRWDPVVARIGDGWDTLLGENVDVWGALAPSDFHNADPADLGDYWPCEFAETWVYAPERTANGVLRALHAGTFWGGHGKLAREVDLRVTTTGLPRGAMPGESISVPAGATATVELRVAVPDRQWDGSPSGIDLLEIIGVTPSGAAALASASPDPKTSSLSHTLTVPRTGIVVRARGRHTNSDGSRLWFYTNPVRILAK